MRFATILCLTLSVVGCAESSAPRSPMAPTPPVATPPQQPIPPSPQPATMMSVWGIVIDPSGECIEGATVEVVAGPRLVGQKATQRLPCDLARSAGGFEFDEGIPFEAITLTLRTAAPGYVSQVQTVAIDSWDTILRLTLVPTGF